MDLCQKKCSKSGLLEERFPHFKDFSTKIYLVIHGFYNSRFFPSPKKRELQGPPVLQTHQNNYIKPLNTPVTLQRKKRVVCSTMQYVFTHLGPAGKSIWPLVLWQHWGRKYPPQQEIVLQKKSTFAPWVVTWFRSDLVRI